MHIIELFPESSSILGLYDMHELLLIPDWNVPDHETEQLPSHKGKGLLQLPLARHVTFCGPIRWYPALHTKVTLLLYVFPVEMASAFSIEGCSPQVIPRRGENFLVLYRQHRPFCLSVTHHLTALFTQRITGKKRAVKCYSI